MNKTRLRILGNYKKKYEYTVSEHFNKLFFWHVCNDDNEPITVNELIKLIAIDYKIYEQK